MDKSAIKSFAIEARKILMKSAVTQAGFYGVSKDGCAQPTQKGAGFEVYRTIAGTDNRIYGDDIKRREKLVKAVEEKGFAQVIEETAYTWFNRLIAIRFMEVNGYLPTRTRVLSSETGSNTPDLMSQYMDVDLDMTMDELEKVQTCVRENRYDDAFALLFVKQCNALNEILPELFEKTTDYMELLLKLSYTSDGVVRMLVDTIPESNFDIEQEGQIEIIGWMYQYYNTELKDDTFALLKKNVKITKERIPSATQLFTPDWIVRYMVENSLGRLWVEGHPDEDLKANWKYYLEEAEQEKDVQEQLEKIREEYRDLNPEDIKVIDPCMGSGHILVYCFDVLMQIYESQGYSQRDAAGSILANNLYGLDIDKRAAQLAYFAVMMKARQYDRRILFRNIYPHVYAIEESNGINRKHLNSFGVNFHSAEKNIVIKQILKLLDDFTDAKEYGSLIEGTIKYDWKQIEKFVKDIDNLGQISFETLDIDITSKKLMHLIEAAKVLTNHYDIVVTNPPYMGISSCNAKLNTYLKKNYNESKNDLFSAFIVRSGEFSKIHGYVGIITQNSWMFLSRFEGMREKFLTSNNIVSMIHLGAHAFEEISGEAVQTTTFIFEPFNIRDYEACYIRLVDINNYTQKEQVYLDIVNNSECNKKYISSKKYFEYLPGMPIAYWLPENAFYPFQNMKVYDVSVSASQNVTGNNDKYLREFWEVDINKIGVGNKWIFYAKGGGYRKWYGNMLEIVDWSEAARNNYQKGHGSQIIPEQYWYKKGITWGLTSQASFRILPEGSTYDKQGSSIFINNDKDLIYVLGLLNSCVANYYLQVLNPSLSYQVRDIRNIPLLDAVLKNEKIKENSIKCIDLARQDWNEFEISQEYSEHPLVRLSKCLWDITEVEASMQRYYQENISVEGTLELCFLLWKGECQERYDTFKRCEEKLNEIFIGLYGLEKELVSTVDSKDVTVRLADFERDIKGLISYAVGCMFGRYSLDVTGLAFAGGNWDASKYSTFLPDKDNCIPITDEEYFEDDIVGQFVGWMKKVFGSDNLEENLDFIAKALGNKGTTSREVIRNYFLNDFMKDHIKIYQKRPIYWMFDSGKQNGFKCLTYMHRYDKDTVGRVRSDYLRKSQEAIEAALKNAEYTIQNSTSAIDKATATKKRDKYIKQLSEIRTYFQALSHVALQRIDIDLDDGVKVNYEKFQNIEIVDENGKKQKINLLTKI